MVAVVPACDETAEMGEELSEKTGAFGILLEAHQQGADRRALIKNGLTNAGRCGRTQNPAKGIQGYGAGWFAPSKTVERCTPRRSAT